LADKSTQLMLDALSRAVAEPTGLPLFGNKTNPGLFVATSAARFAAQRCIDEALVRVLRSEQRGKTTQDICAITDKGMQYLLTQVSPRQVLEDLVRAVEARQAQLGEVVNAARQAQATLDGLRSAAQQVLAQVRPEPVDGQPAAEQDAWHAAALECLGRWQSTGASQDCPLPELYRELQLDHAALTVGQFHDGLRRLDEQRKIYLHPWTGPLCDLPQPVLALLVGHVIAYYASLRG
jgi:hypothetical protein